MKLSTEKWEVASENVHLRRCTASCVTATYLQYASFLGFVRLAAEASLLLPHGTDEKNIMMY